MKENQPVLVLVFGHGDLDSLGIAIGGEGSESAPRLTREKFNSAIRTGVDVSLLRTSCYSGGWVLQPIFGSPLLPAKKLNTSGMAPVIDDEVSRAWASIQSYGWAGRCIYPAAVLSALVDMSKTSSCDSSDAIFDDYEITTSPTYHNLCSSVYEAYKEHDPFANEHGVSFSAQDDKWDTEWRPRSGFPLLDYKKKWEELREVPSTQPGDETSTSTPDPTATSGFTGSIGRGYHNTVKANARAYMDSFPGPDNGGCNTVHASFKQLLAGEECDDELLAWLNGTLDYRLSLMQLASQYVSFLDLQFHNGLVFDTEAWHYDLALKAEKDDDSTDAKSKLEKFKQARRYIIEAKLFDRPVSGQGFSYAKPKEYLAIALVESSSLSIDEIRDTIDRLVRLKVEAQRFLATMPLAEAMMKKDEVVRHRDRFYETVRKLLRDLEDNGRVF